MTNENAGLDFSHIKDAYFRDKLERGLIKYDPSEWTELEPIEENSIR